MITAAIFLLISFVVLYYGAEWLVRGASSIALNLKVSKTVIGLTLVAFGTSSPELVVNLLAASKGHTAFALSNISGSNLANICLGFGLCSLIATFEVNRKEFRVDMVVFGLAPLMVVCIIWIWGALVVASVYFFAALLIVYMISIRNRMAAGTDTDAAPPRDSVLVGFVYFVLGCLSLYIGGELVIRGAIIVAESLSVSKNLIGFTIVAIGTSIPDISASVIAIRRNEISIAAGNILGSNIFNVLLVLGGTLILSGSDLAASSIAKVEYAVVLLVSILLILLVCCVRRFRIKHGIILISIYILFMFVRIKYLGK